MAQGDPLIYSRDPGGHFVLFCMQWWFNLVAVVQQRAWFHICFLEDGSEEGQEVDAELGFGKLLPACKCWLCGEFAEAACIVNSQNPRGAVPVCVGSPRGWAAVDGGHLCSQGQEDRGCGCAFKPHRLQDLFLLDVSFLRATHGTLESVSLSIIIPSELINFQQS